MGKVNHLLNHLRNPAYRDEASRLVFGGDPNRLCPTYVGSKGDWQVVARLVAASTAFRVSWFPDANIAILDDATPVWDALRLAALGSSAGSTIFTAIVLKELHEWLDAPYRNKERATTIRTAIDAASWARKFGLDEDSPILTAILGYLRLFGLRRFLTLATGAGATLFGTDPADKGKTMDKIIKNIGPRAQGLAKKGRADTLEKKEVSINDELHVLLAISHSLLTGRESVVLTADEDLIEIFWKAQWFFDTHYRAWLAAKLVSEGEFGKPAGTLENTLGYFAGPVTLYRRPTSHLREVLPQIYHPVHASVIYVAPNRTIQKLSFPFERQMLGMLETRSRTNGRCTDLFGQDNIHVDLGPIKPSLDGLYLGIGRDVSDLVQTNTTKTFLSRLDQEHAINCRERLSDCRGFFGIQYL